jgi:hypothetical protein
MQVPSIARHTARRFFSISIWVIAGGVAGYLVPIWINFCQEQFGNGLYGLIPLALVPMLWFSYTVAKHDVERETRRNGRVLDELRKD